MTEFPSKSAIQSYRAQTFSTTPQFRITTVENAVDFVRKRGFVLFWPIKGITYPSLWAAAAGDRPVASEHDDPGHKTWGWKDQLLDQRVWYYAKIIRGKATMISLDIAPYFYALSKNYGEPELDYLEQYYDGKLSQPARLIFEALLENGPLDTIQLKRMIHMTAKSSKSVFDRTMVELQRDFKILPMGISDSGSWRYSFIYDLVHRYYPNLPDEARKISTKKGQTELLETYFNALGAASINDVKKFFTWTSREVKILLNSMVEDQKLIVDPEAKGQMGDKYALIQLAGG